MPDGIYKQIEVTLNKNNFIDSLQSISTEKTGDSCSQNTTSCYPNVLVVSMTKPAELAVCPV